MAPKKQEKETNPNPSAVAVVTSAKSGENAVITDRDINSLDEASFSLQLWTTLLVVILLCPFLWKLHTIQDWEKKREIIVCLLVSVLGAIGTYFLIPSVKLLNLKAGLFGIDINKVEGKKIPESMGIVPGTVYLMCVIFFQLYVDESLLAEYNAAMTSICFMIFLGFADDVLNLRWRYKLVLPSVATLPLLVAYRGSTTVLVPRFLHPYFGPQLALGIFYQIYMGLLSVFCSNAINIYAGLNGLEAGQSLVIGCSILYFNLSYLENGPFAQAHLFSVFLTLPFVFATLGLLYFNWYPSRVFVGDTYTYFAGMVFAVVGILGHYSETLLLFFIPQIINFIYSIPQLIGIIPCPRHRLPKYNKDTKKLEPTPNLTLINLTLRIIGPTSERNLCIILLIFQVFCCALGLGIRNYIAELIR
eukprot:TRINITY_DN2328_c0_g2_i3.p1 TRINITY_DN2328_c0_g2~~TRINITY_DN2328_c0_g2_i3.p1  ORF type:complete len:417 (+),score=80.23 TRINITY_DN2328_c0_g2_i3:53-1303(+)